MNWSLCTLFQSPATSSLSDPNRPQHPALEHKCSSPGVRNQVSHPHETAGRNVCLSVKYINCFEFLRRVIICLFVVGGVLQVPRGYRPDRLCLTTFRKAPHTVTSVEGFALRRTNWLRSGSCVGRHVRSRMCTSLNDQY